MRTKGSCEGFKLDCFLPRRGPSTIRQALGGMINKCRGGVRDGAPADLRTTLALLPAGPRLFVFARGDDVRARAIKSLPTAPVSCGMAQAQAADTLCRSPATVHVFGRRLHDATRGCCR